MSLQTEQKAENPRHASRVVQTKSLAAAYDYDDQHEVESTAAAYQLKTNQNASEPTQHSEVTLPPPKYAPTSDTGELETTQLKETTEHLSASADAPDGNSAPNNPNNPNNTGLPNALKSGVEKLSGLSLDDVHVHYNSAKPASLGAHAYAQGTDIHLASGQEKHLAHEAWHVVQQKQGRVKPSKQLKSANINDDSRLEKEADVMGAKAMNVEKSPAKKLEHPQKDNKILKYGKIAQLEEKPKSKGVLSESQTDEKKYDEKAKELKSNLQAEFDTALINAKTTMENNGENDPQKIKEAAYDKLAAFIASKTEVRKLVRQEVNGEVHGYNFTEDTLRINENKEVMQYLHEIGYWADKPRRMKISAERIYNDFKGVDEAIAKDKIKDLILTRPDAGITEEKMRKDGFQGKVFEDKDIVASQAANDNFAWSAAMISKVQHEAGAGDTFNYSDMHLNYAKTGRTNKTEGKDHIDGIEKLHKSSDMPIKIGDTIFNGRDEKKSTYEKIQPKSHSDVVVRLITLNGKKYAEVIGGNTSNHEIKSKKNRKNETVPGAKRKITEIGSETVGKKYVELTEEGFIKNYDAYFGVSRTDTGDPLAGEGNYEEEKSVEE